MTDTAGGVGDIERAETVAPPQRSALRRRLAGLATRLGELGPVRRALLARTDTAVLTPRLLARALSAAARRRAEARLARLPSFAPSDYLRLHPDVGGAGIVPAFHALFIGPFEERAVFRAEALARCLARPLPAEAASAAVACANLSPIGVLVSSLGNQFMHEIAADFAASLRAGGASVALLDETGSAVARPALCVVVAPHEFFRLGRGPAWVREEVIAGAVMLNTEQPQTKWFAAALPFLLAARGVIDLSAQTAALLAHALPALHLTPSPQPPAALSDADRAHALFRVLPAAARTAAVAGTAFADRALDIACFAAESPHREAWLGRHAARLAEYDCVVHYRREDRGPIRPGAPDGALTRLARHVCGHARITLNLHRDGFGLLEWHRVVRLGMASGSVVVSEPCLPHPRLTPGVHYLEATSRQIPNLLDWLLRSDDGARHAAEVQHHAARLLAETLTPTDTAARVAAFLAALPR